MARHTDSNRLIQELVRLGCDVSRNKSGNWRVAAPGSNRIVFVAESMTERRALKNKISELRRLGLNPAMA